MIISSYQLNAKRTGLYCCTLEGNPLKLEDMAFLMVQKFATATVGRHGDGDVDVDGDELTGFFYIILKYVVVLCLISCIEIWSLDPRFHLP